ncbi:unnamed protein product [Phaedon cochleariae]|uniref:Myosuppressin n=1 Tax=Phaedon cochleariae TaxID=80249 RepID=A0A9P0DJY9_PHACE|nr:unnamed protein product [Phaedon cochleariae]
MNSSTILSWLCGALLAILVSSLARAATISCPPTLEQEQLRPALRQLCYALEQMVEDMPQQEQPCSAAGRVELRDVSKKRQQVDHVFLRFGRRMGQ